MSDRIITVADVDSLIERYTVIEEYRDIGSKIENGKYRKPDYNKHGGRNFSRNSKSDDYYYKVPPPWLKRDVLKIAPSYLGGIAVYVK